LGIKDLGIRAHGAVFCVWREQQKRLRFSSEASKVGLHAFVHSFSDAMEQQCLERVELRYLRNVGEDFNFPISWSKSESKLALSLQCRGRVNQLSPIEDAGLLHINAKNASSIDVG
jgi:hypothetical protein